MESPSKSNTRINQPTPWATVSKDKLKTSPRVFFFEHWYAWHVARFPLRVQWSTLGLRFVDGVTLAPRRPPFAPLCLPFSSHYAPLVTTLTLYRNLCFLSKSLDKSLSKLMFCFLSKSLDKRPPRATKSEANVVPATPPSCSRTLSRPLQCPNPATGTHSSS